MRYCPHCGERLDALPPPTDPLGEAFMQKLSSLGASFVDTPSEPCPECGLRIGHWSHCSRLRDGVYVESHEATEG